MKKIGRLHVITGAAAQSSLTHIAIARQAIAGGADVIQFRDKFMAIGELIETAEKIKQLCRDAGATFIVNDRVDVVMAVDADGVHLGADDLPISVARRIIGPRRIIGGSAPTPDIAARVHAEGADYVGVGHVFPTRSKHKAKHPIGAAGVGWVAVDSLIPVIAIGGINAANLDSVLDTGAHGIAVIGAVSGANDPEAATRELRRAIDLRRS